MRSRRSFFMWSSYAVKLKTKMSSKQNDDDGDRAIKVNEISSCAIVMVKSSSCFSVLYVRTLKLWRNVLLEKFISHF